MPEQTHKDWVDTTVRKDYPRGHVDGALVVGFVALLVIGAVIIAGVGYAIVRVMF